MNELVPTLDWFARHNHCGNPSTVKMKTAAGILTLKYRMNGANNISFGNIMNLHGGRVPPPVGEPSVMLVEVGC